jgi:hypothetical protein
MADHARTVRTPSRGQDPAPGRSGERHEALDRRAAAGPMAAYRALLDARPAGPRPIQRAGAAVVQRAPHRADQGSQITYLGQPWHVLASAAGNPVMTITRGNQTRTINWAAANYTIPRANTAQDHDLRENNLGAVTAAGVAAPIDRYADLDPFALDQKIRENFKAGRVRALAMIKASARNHANQASHQSLNALTLDDFAVTQLGEALSGAGKPQQPAEWQAKWVEGNAVHPRRTWTFEINSDDPLPENPQDPHVGWTVSAAAGSELAVNNIVGHVWLDRVPVKR